LASVTQELLLAADQNELWSRKTRIASSQAAGLTGNVNAYYR
jgi:hypothetical protein